MKENNDFFAANQRKAFAMVRIVTGLMMIYQGVEVFDSTKIQEYSQWDLLKGSVFPMFMSYLGKGSELLIGILFPFGPFIRFAAFLMISTIFYIAFKIGNFGMAINTRLCLFWLELFAFFW